jgi:hypothetical protein
MSGEVLGREEEESERKGKREEERGREREEEEKKRGLSCSLLFLNFFHTQNKISETSHLLLVI